MPTIPHPLALIQLSIADPTLPWSNPVWQSLTSVLGDPWVYNHGGDKSAAATYVAEWTVGKAQAVEAFINNCKSAQDPALHYAVTRKDNDHEGRSSWNIWVKTSWAKWKINTLVDNILQESGCEPHDVMARLNCKSADDFPTMEAAQIKQVAAIKLADALFGDDAFTDGSFLVAPIMTFVTTLLASTWSRYRKVLKRQATGIDKKTREVEEEWRAMTATNAKPTIASIRTYLKKLEALRREQVNTMLAAAKKDPTKAESVARLPKSLRDALDRLATEEEVKELELLIETTLAAMVPLEGDKVVIDFAENIDVGDWKSGVEEYDKRSEDELWEDLGLPEKKLPFFQTRSDPDAAVDPWSEEGQQWLDNSARCWTGRPVMLMDGVGIGKTMQAVGLIACLAHYREHYRKHGKFPGKFAQRFCKKTGGNIPDLPTVITSPPNLHHQWMSEIQRYLRRATFDVLPYTGKYTARSQWWTMAWTKCQQPSIRRIILATTNAAQDDAATVFIQGDRDSYRQPMHSPRFERTSPSTLFGHEYITSIIDEGHILRNINLAHTAARALQGKSHSTVMMTATPVTTKPADLWNIGLLLGIEQLKDITQLKTMNRELTAAQRRDQAAQEEYLPVMRKWIGRMREWFSPAVILRTVDSTDNTGNKILGLPPYHDHTLKIKLLDWEMENLRNIARGYLDDCLIVGMSKNFYVEFRRSILHPHMNPTEERMKLDVLAILLKYHLESDGRRPLIMDESGRHLVPNPAFAAGNINPDEPDRIIIFSAFVTSNQAIVDILDLHSIHALELNGQTPMRKRKDILDKFRSSARPNGPRVLILSGSWWDTLWSEQDDRQLRGRIYRHPQAKEVHVYRAIALKTADVFLNNISFSKGAMHEAFIGADKEFRCMFDDDGSAMGDLISISASTPKLDDSTDGDDTMDVDPEPTGGNKAGKKKARTKATPKNPLSPTRPATKGKGNKVKSIAVDTDDESGGTSHKRRKDVEQPASPVTTSKEAHCATSQAIAPPQSQGGTQSSHLSPAPINSSAVLKFGDDRDDLLLSSPPPRSPQPSSPPLLSPSPPLSNGHFDTVPAHTPAVASTSVTQSDQPAGVQDGRLHCVVEKELADCGQEMDWNDSGSYSWNDGDEHGSCLTVELDEQPPWQDHRPCTSADNVFNERRPALCSGTPVMASAVRSSSARAEASRNLGESVDNQCPRPRIPKPGPSSRKWSGTHIDGPQPTQAGRSRAPGQTFNPVQLSPGPAHAATFSSKDRIQQQRSRR
ncbi:P-loop containing nucleoside triphosphate hydrolase protein [Suillus subluteus]|nr:P-loop containing nucleoside triphosphate hydrolase protein [Suillus subluteus]